MKYYKIKFTLLLFAVFTVVSCEDVLDTESKSAFQEELIYDDPVQVERLVYTVYNSTESWGLNRFQWWSRRFNIEGASYEAKFNFQNKDLFALRGTGWTSSRTGVFSDKWSNYWYYIRSADMFLDKIDESGAMEKEPAKVKVLKAEMKFLRANIYAKLIKYYGGVPILEHALGLNDEFNLSRNTYKECVDFIVKELDEATAVLPKASERSDSEFGRATKEAALAVKSRTLLYAASKLHNPSTVPNGPFYDYDVATKWQDAADAAKTVIDLVGGRNLLQVANAKEYQALFITPNQDILFARPFGSDFYDYGKDVVSLPDQTQSPSGYGGWALSSPTHNFSLEFNMADGSSTNGTTPADPNANREMRYYADLLYNGANFRNREVEYFLSDDVNVFSHGLDSSEGQGNIQHSSKTGYNIRKFQDEGITELTDVSASRPYILYRLAEIYLNYAEAQYHLGNEGEALTSLNKVATRALLPTITASGTDLLNAIKRERRVELCFEGHNFFDERRWMDESRLGFDIKGLTWKKAIDGSMSFQEYTILTRPWFEKQYYLPIPSTEIFKAPALKQNMGY